MEGRDDMERMTLERTARLHGGTLAITVSHAWRNTP
jgi:hypothetical protein